MLKVFTTLSLVAISTCCLGETTEPYLTLGYSAHSVNYTTGDPTFDDEKKQSAGYHFGVGIRKQFENDHFLGAGIDIDDIDGQRLTGFRAIDYQYQISKRYAVGFFIGAASLDSGLPQNGYYLGANLSYIALFRNVDLVFDTRYASGLARDRLLADDPVRENPDESPPDIFADIASTSLSLNWRF